MDAALARFLAWVHAVHAVLAPRGWWVDAVNPATGRALLGRPGSKPWAEAEAARHLLGYPVAQGVTCSLLMHPRLGEIPEFWVCGLLCSACDQGGSGHPRP